MTSGTWSPLALGGMRGRKRGEREGDREREIRRGIEEEVDIMVYVHVSGGVTHSRIRGGERTFEPMTW